MTKRNTIVDAIKALLTDIPGVNNANVYRSKAQPLSRNEFPAVAIELGLDTPQFTAVGVIDWVCAVSVGVLVAGNIPDEIADPIVESVHEKIMADPTLGGLAMDIQPAQVRFELLNTDMTAMIVSMGFLVTYRTSEKTLS